MPRFNYTGRKKIKHQDIIITVFDNNGLLKFDADIDLSDYSLPVESPVYVEAYRQTSWMRFGFGKAESIKPESDNRLSEFDSLDGIRFRVKVSQTDGTHGKILAIADKIRPVKPEEGDAGRLCILHVKSEEMDSIWKLDFEGGYPILLISKKAGSKDIISQSPEFISLVYPSVLREILYKIKTDSDPDWMDEDDSWQSQWIKFVSLLPSVGEIPDLEDNAEEGYNQWVDDAVESFSRNMGIVETYISVRGEGE